MQKNKFTLFLFVSFLFITSCVQKTYKKTVVFELDTKDVKNIKTVGVKGNDKPLNWNYVKEMTAVKKDTTYSIALTFLTGYKFTEVKFSINGDFELKDKGNRRIEFSDKDTTVYKAVFNVAK